jgi:hypothetical protein
MKRLLLGLLFSASLSFHAQVFWTEAFGSGACSGGVLASAYSGTNGAWSITNTGTNGSAANTWYVSAKEQGMGLGNCGAGCAGTNNKTLHVGSTGFFTDLGAAYNATGSSNITDKRANSPVINCTGKTGISLSFNYLEFGEGSSDNATLEYFNGSAWSLLVDVPKITCCGPANCTGQQGLWTAYSIAMPASADNNAGVRIGFRWVNNGNGIGTDPSFAVDDIQLSTPAVLPIELAGFFYEMDGTGRNWLRWRTVHEKKSDQFVVERSIDGEMYSILGTVKAAGESNSEKKYEFYDSDKLYTHAYYRLKMVDFDQSFQYAGPIVTSKENQYHPGVGYFVNESELEIEEYLIDGSNVSQITIYNAEGKIVFSHRVKELEKSNGKTKVPLKNLPTGVYMFQLEGTDSRKSFKFLISP